MGVGCGVGVSGGCGVVWGVGGEGESEWREW